MSSGPSPMPLFCCGQPVDSHNLSHYRRIDPTFACEIICGSLDGTVDREKFAFKQLMLHIMSSDVSFVDTDEFAILSFVGSFNASTSLENRIGQVELTLQSAEFHENGIDYDARCHSLLNVEYIGDACLNACGALQEKARSTLANLKHLQDRFNAIVSTMRSSERQQVLTALVADPRVCKTGKGCGNENYFRRWETAVLDMLHHNMKMKSYGKAVSSVAVIPSISGKKRKTDTGTHDAHDLTMRHFSSILRGY